MPASVLFASPLSGWRSWRPTLFLCLAGIVVPNAISLGALIAGVGVPPRPSVIAAYAALAIIARILPWPITVALYVAALGYDIVSTVALLFNLAPSEILLAVRLATNLNLFSSPLYVGLGSAALIFAAVNIVLLTTKRPLLRRGNVSVMAGLAVCFAALDFFTNTSLHYQFGTLYGAGKPMASASLSSGFHQTILGDKKRPVLLVMVEALGEFANPAHRALLTAPFNDEALAKRYNMTSGSTVYYGSTTAAEMRELCATRDSYQTLIDGADIRCLPHEMVAKGYRTVSVHNFGSQFFQRREWYPKIGFERSIFQENLASIPMRSCGGPFRGPCDTEMIPILAKELRDTRKPTFLYWLTLSTHVPIAPREGTSRLSCDRDGGQVGQTEVCFMTEMWIDVFTAIARMTADLPPMDVLIVGDHAPPLWSKVGRHLFVPGQVPWFRLSPKDNVNVAVPRLLAPRARVE